MERRLAVLAGPDIKALIVCHTRRAWILVLAVASLAGAAGTADARPKRRDARLAFDRGVAAYQSGDFAAASEALGRSYQIEHDVETLFAWAQAERKLEHCDKAIELYGKLLAFKLPAANKAAVEQKIEECRTIVAAQAPKAGPAPEPPASAGPPSPSPAPAEPAAPPPVAPPAAAASDRPAGPPDVPPTPPTPAAHLWYKNPITLSVLGAGAAGLGAGVTFTILANSEGDRIPKSPTLEEARQHDSKANSRRTISRITGGVGIGLALVGGVLIWREHDSGERRTVTGWLAPGGGGLAITGPF